MTKGEFMRELAFLLSKIPENEKNDALEYYSDYFADAGIEDDMIIPASVGTPKQVADTIISETVGEEKGNIFEDDATFYEGNKYNNNRQETSYYNSQRVKNDSIQNINYNNNQNNFNENDNSRMVVAIILIIAFSPVWLGLISGIGGLLFSVIAALGGIIIGLCGAGIGLMIAAFFFGSIAGKILLLGTGMLLFALGFLCIIPLVMYCGQFLPWLFKEIGQLFQGILGKRRKPNE